jgi:PEGA domain
MIHRTVILFALLLALGPRSARADGDVGVVVTGDPTMQPQLLAMVEGWLRSHGHQLVASPLPPEATNKLIDCFVIEDMSCARKVVESQAKTATVVFARVEVADNAQTSMRDVTITAYWFERGSDPVAEKRSCDKCTDTALHETGDALMSALAGSSRKTVGQLKLTSRPDGAHVTIDGRPSGTTPLEVVLAPGEHQLVFSADGRSDVTRSMTVVQGTNPPMDIALGAAGAARSKLPLAIMGGGAALLVTGVILFATSETDTGEKFEYRDTKPLGIGLMAGGLAVAGVGAYLWFVKKPTDSAPAVAILPGGAYVGWGKAF